MVGRLSAFREMVRQASQDLVNRFNTIERTLNTSREERTIEELYSKLDNINSSQQALAASPKKLAVLRA
jgi:flagellar hook-associated protein FlgK